MKQKDIAIIIVVIFFSCIVSYIISSKFIFTPAKYSQQVEVVPAISSSFKQDQVAPKYINSQSLDPTKFIQIGNNSNLAPFSNGQ